MKKILTSALALGAMTLIIGCGGDDRFVEFKILLWKKVLS